MRYALDGHGYIFSCTVIIFDPHDCPRAVSRGKSVRRSAQDDDLLGVVKKNILNKSELMGLRPG